MCRDGLVLVALGVPDISCKCNEEKMGKRRWMIRETMKVEGRRVEED